MHIFLTGTDWIFNLFTELLLDTYSDTFFFFFFPNGVYYYSENAPRKLNVILSNRVC